MLRPYRVSKTPAAAWTPRLRHWLGDSSRRRSGRGGARRRNLPSQGRSMLRPRYRVSKTPAAAWTPRLPATGSIPEAS